MSMNQVPTLVLGIGGIGCQIAAEINDRISPADAQHVSVIGLDTNVHDLALLREKHNIQIIQTSDDRRVDAYLTRHPEYCEWFPDNPYLRQRDMKSGAGQVRTLSRLACLAAEEAGRFDVIKDEIDRIRRVDSNPNNNCLAVVIVGSITGGTGAGLFLHMPFYIRKLLKTQVGLTNTVIRGMFIGPDIMEGVQPGPDQKDSVCVNGYTCLKELNSFYLRPTMCGKNRENNLHLDFYDHKHPDVDNIPYNYLYIVEKSNNTGSMGDVRVEEVIGYTAQILYTLMFSPANAGALSVEDNFILTSIKAGGMNRFAGAGMCKLTYPREAVQDYVTLSVVHDLVQKEWMLVDQNYEALAKAATMQRKTDGTTEIPPIERKFVEIFDELVIGENATLGTLLSEAFVKENQDYVPISNSFIKTFDTMIKNYLTDKKISEVPTREEECKVDKQKMKKFSDAESEISRVWEAMQEYASFAQTVIKTLPMTYANTMFPTADDVMRYNKTDSRCIYQLLATVHPVVARYFIYRLINYFTDLIAKLKIKLNHVNLMTYREEDFDPKTKDIQGPTTALEKIRKDRSAIWKILGPVGEAVNSEEKALRKLRTKLEQVSDTHVKITHEFLANSLRLRIAKLLLERLTELSEDYRIFFSTVNEQIERNNENLATLEHITFSYGHDGIYCTKEALQKTAGAFINRQRIDLSGETKQAIFENIYAVLARKYAAASVSDTQADIEHRVQEAKRSLDLVFKNAVIDTIHTDVIKNGNGIVNLTAKQALVKEFEMKSHKIEGDADYERECAIYVHDRITNAMKVAEPMLATDHQSAATEIVFLALAPRCAELDTKMDPDNSKTAKYYLTAVDAHTTVIIDESFADTEITCMRLSYNFTLEELKKYQDGARYQTAYAERIAALRTMPERGQIGQMDETSIVISPHLDCYWHEEGFIQSIETKQRQIDHMDHMKAFIYGLGMDKFKLIDDDRSPDENGRPRPTWFAYLAGSMDLIVVKKCGRKIGSSFNDLYDAILYNGGIKQDVLRDARAQTEVMKGYRTAEQLFNEILENTFILDLIHNEDDGVQQKDYNIFDIFHEMRSYMPEKEWKDLFKGLYATLTEFCETLFDRSAYHINKAMIMILDAIYENSKASKLTNDTVAILLKEQYNILKQMRYEE